MPTPRPLKKSESLEIRIPYPTKQAFMEHCRREGLSASEALRTLIEQRIEGAPPPPRAPVSRGRFTLMKIIAGALAAAAVGAVAAPTLAHQGGCLPVAVSAER